MYPRHIIPGVAFEVPPPAFPDALPRMDVALFVGFAARGPCHRPVRIDSVEAYAQVFGGDAVLCRDLSRGDDAMAALAPAVRAFFSNGGARCWVIRTCRTETLETLWRGGSHDGADVAAARVFAVPGVLALKADGGTEPALVCAASVGSWADGLRVSARLDRTAFLLRDPEFRIGAITFASVAELALGDLIELSSPTWSGFATVTDVAGGSTTARLLSNAETAPLGAGEDLTADGLRLVLRAEDSGGELQTGSPVGLTPLAADSWWSTVDDDAFYASQDATAQSRSTLAPCGDTPIAWLPVGLGDTWSDSVGPQPDERTALERDGLSRFDAELFLDPALAGLHLASIATEAQRVRDLDGRSLLGLHGAFAVPGGADFGEPSLMVVPDAAQPGWDRRIAEALTPPVDAPAEEPAAWRDHRGSCAVPPADPTATGPDRTRFLDCGVRLLPTPIFDPVDSPAPTGVLDLSWSASEPAAIYILEESGRADFDGAEEIWRGPELTHRTSIAREGAYYYRLHAELDGNISRSSVIGLLAQDSAWAARTAKAFDPTPLLQIQVAQLRACAAMGDQFAPLSLPGVYRARQAADHASRLRAAFPENEVRALSFGALYHPWLASPIGRTNPRSAALGQTLLETPPLGAVAGVFALKARERGAWIAPANTPLRDIVATTPTILDSDREALAGAGVNLIRRAPEGFVISDALTLSPEPDWDEVNVRRLMSLLRRVCIQRGSAYVFEPNGEVVRRAIERSFGHMLDDMVRRGAFAGEGGSDSYRLSVDTSDSDRMNGRLIVEIGVAPSQPLRFLTIVLAQAGERFTIAEER